MAGLEEERTKSYNMGSSWVMKAVKTSLLISVYFGLSIGLTFYQRSLLQKLDFPLFTVVCHLTIKFLIAWLCRCIWESHKRQSRVILSWQNYMLRVCPTGLASGLDVAFSNWGLALVTVSLYTMTKSTVILFILGFALLFKLEQKSWSLIIIVFLISSGLFLFTYKATQFNLQGFLLVLFASFTSGLRWTLAQSVMQKVKLGLSNPIDMVYHVQPWMLVSVLPFAVFFEGEDIASSCQLFRFHASSVLVLSTSLIIGGAFIAFLMEVSEYLVVCHTSSLTLSVAGILKEVVTLVLAVEWAGDQMSKTNVFGLILCLGGIIVHGVSRVFQASHIKHEEFHELHSIPLLETNSDYLHDQSSDDTDEDSSTILFSILQRRET